MPLTTGFSHIATMTDDVDRLIGFYRAGLRRRAHVRHGGGRPPPRRHRRRRPTVLHAFHVPWATTDDRREMFERGRIDHYGVTVPSVDALLEVRRRLRPKATA